MHAGLREHAGLGVRSQAECGATHSALSGVSLASMEVRFSDGETQPLRAVTGRTAPPRRQEVRMNDQPTRSWPVDRASLGAPSWEQIVDRPLRARLPPRLPADRQPARRRGPHPGGLRPGVPLAATPTRPAPSRAGCTGSPRTCSSTRPAARAGSGSTRSPTTPPTGCRARCPTPDAAYLDQMFDADIEAALASLAPDFRAAVVLCDVEGLTYEEIADVLDLKMGTVRSRIHRGRAMLRTALAHRAPAAGAHPVSPAPTDRRTPLRSPDEVPAVIRQLHGPHRLDRVGARRRPARPPPRRSAPGRTSWAAPVPPAGRARGLAQAPARHALATPRPR